MQISPFFVAVTSQAERHSRRRCFVGFYLVFGTVCMCMGLCVSGASLESQLKFPPHLQVVVVLLHRPDVASTNGPAEQTLPPIHNPHGLFLFCEPNLNIKTVLAKCSKWLPSLSVHSTVHRKRKCASGRGQWLHAKQGQLMGIIDILGRADSGAGSLHQKLS